MKKKFYYGWVLMVVTFITMGLVNYLGVSSFSLFVAPAVKTMGVSAAAFLTCATMSSLGGVVGSAIGGKMLDKYGLRIVGTIGAVLIGLGFLGLSFANSMPLFYVCYFVIGAATCGTGTVFINKMASKWFNKYRGTVTGICAAGQSTMTVILASLFAKNIEANGMSNTYLIMAIILFVVAALIILLMRNSPEDMGLYPDGAEQIVESDNSVVKEATGLSAGEAMKTPAFWLIIIGFGVFNIASLGVIQTYNAHFQNVGYTPVLAAISASTYGFAGIFTRIGWGRVADKVNHKIATIIGSAIFIGSIIFLSFVTDASSNIPLYVFGITYAIGNGYVWAIMVKYIGNNFGTKAFGQISGYIMTAMMACSMLGSPLAGAIFDKTGSYSTAYRLFAIIALVATCLLLLSKKPEQSVEK